MTPDAAELVLDQLLERDGGETPADELARKLGLTAPEVYEAIESLRRTGYDIGWLEHGSARGFILRGEPRRIFAAELLRVALRRLAAGREIGHRLIHHREVESTNDVARALAEDGAPHGTAVLAERQTAGRGRRGRTWVSPPGENVYLSLVLRPELPAERAFELTLLAAVALAEALEFCGVAPGIKWPNDVELGGRKVAGILAELSTSPDGLLRHVVLGLGVNVNAPLSGLPEEIRARATSLSSALGRPVSCARVVTAFFDRFEEWLVLHRSLGFGAVLDTWRARSTTLGTEVRALVEGQVISGVAEDVDDTGALLVRDDAGRLHRIVAGEISSLR